MAKFIAPRVRANFGQKPKSKKVLTKRHMEDKLKSLRKDLKFWKEFTRGEEIFGSFAIRKCWTLEKKIRKLTLDLEK